MEKIDPILIKRLQKLEDQYSRSIPINSKRSYCTKEIFWARVGKILKHKAFKIKHKGKVTYLLLTGYTHTRIGSKNEDTLKSYGVTKKLDWSSSLSITLSGINHHVEREEIDLKYNDLLRLEYEEISIKKYSEIAKLFI